MLVELKHCENSFLDFFSLRSLSFCVLYLQYHERLIFFVCLFPFPPFFCLFSYFTCEVGFAKDVDVQLVFLWGGGMAGGVIRRFFFFNFFFFSLSLFFPFLFNFEIGEERELTLFFFSPLCLFVQFTLTHFYFGNLCLSLSLPFPSLFSISLSLAFLFWCAGSVEVNASSGFGAGSALFSSLCASCTRWMDIGSFTGRFLFFFPPPLL